MTQNLLKWTGVLAITFSMTTAFAKDDSKDVESCANDTYTSQRIQEDIPAADRIDIFNAQKEVVGAFGFVPESGDLYSLYLCGANSGYYYAEGNAYDGSVSSIYNDEYDSEVDSEALGDLTKVVLNHVTFAGEPEDADYPPFSTVFFFKTPTK